MYGRIMSSMSAMWRLYGYQDYPASEPSVVAFEVRTLEQLKDFIRRCEVTDLLIYYGRPEQLKNLKYTEFFQKYNTLKTLPQFYSNNPQAENEMSLHQHYFKIYIYFADKAAIQYIYVPLTQVKRWTCLEVLYITSGDIYYLHLIHLM